MATESKSRNVVRVVAKFTIAGGKTLKEIAAAQEKLETGFAALAEAVGIEVDDIEHTAQPLRENIKSAG